MRNRFVLRLTATLAGIALTATLAGAAPAAAECLAKPKGLAPAGKHWYYSTDRKIQRKCWYLDDADGKIVTAAPQKTSVAAATRPVPQSVEPAQNVDARAELIEEPKVEQTPAPAAAAVAPATPEPQPALSQETPDPGKANGWQVASRWPEPSDSFGASPAPTTSGTAPAAPAEKPPVVVADAAPPAPAAAPQGYTPQGYSDVDVGLIAAALILLVVVSGTLVMLTRRRSAAQAQAMRRVRRRDEMPWTHPAVARTAPAARRAELRDRSEVVDEIEQLLAAGRQPSPSN